MTKLIYDNTIFKKNITPKYWLMVDDKEVYSMGYDVKYEGPLKNFKNDIIIISYV